MKTCKQCGKELFDAAVICPQCGCPVEAQPADNAPVAPQNQAGATTPAAGKLAKNKKLIGIIVGAVAVVTAVVITLVLLLGGSSYEDALDKKMDALFEGDYDAYLEWYPEEYWDKFPNEKMSKSEFEEFTEDFQEEAEGMSVSYEITKEEKVTGSDYDDYCEVIENRWNVDADDIGEIYDIEFEIEIETDDDTETLDDAALIAEIHGEWYIVAGFNSFD